MCCERFDDTNPAKENDEFEETILQDTKLLGVEWERVTHTSDYLPQLQDACTEMIKKGWFAGVSRELRSVVTTPPQTALLDFIRMTSFGS